jgi:hypothetical protein
MIFHVALLVLSDTLLTPVPSALFFADIYDAIN